jgi:hypothetical protein
MNKKYLKKFNNPFSTNHSHSVPRNLYWHFFSTSKRKRKVSITPTSDDFEIEIDLTFPVIILILICTFVFN